MTDPIADRLGLAHVHWAFPPTTGGTESHLYDLALRQAAGGVRVSVLTGESQPLTPARCSVTTTPLLNLDILRSQQLDHEQYRRGLVDFLSGFLSRNDVDVVHGHNLHHFFAEPALALDEVCRQRGTPIHHTFHETWPDLLARTPVYRAWSGNYAISEHVRTECLERLGFRPELLRNPVDSDRFRTDREPFSGPADSVVVLHPARLLPWKGVHVTVEAIGRLHRSGMHVKLVLTDTQRICDWDDQLATYRTEITRLIRSLELTSVVEMVPAAYGDMPQLYSAADIVVYPTVGDEPLGLVPLEAMSCGRPVIATRSGGIPETIIDGVTGYLVDRDDVTGLTAAIDRLAKAPVAARRMGRAGRRHVRAVHDFGRYVELLGERYAASRAGR